MTATDPTAEALDLLAEGAFSVSEAVKFSGVGRTVLFGLLSAGEIPSFTLGSKRLIPRRAMVRWLAAKFEAAKECVS